MVQQIELMLVDDCPSNRLKKCMFIANQFEALLFVAEVPNLI